MSTLLRQVKVSDRKPPVETPVIAIGENGEVARTTMDENGYWWLWDIEADCDEPEYWLEPAPEFTDEEIDDMGQDSCKSRRPLRPLYVYDFGFMDGFKKAVELLKDKEDKL